MPSPSPTDTHPIVARLAGLLALTAEERAEIADLPMQVVDLRADQDIVREGDRPSRCCALLEGFASTYKLTDDGRRQITAFHIPGDVPDLYSAHLKTLDTGLSTLTPCRVAFIQHEHLRGLCLDRPRMADAFWREALVEGAILRQWMLNMGRREAYGRMAHLLCEMLTRMRAAGRAQGDTCALPITQTELGDALGLSTVHANRTLKELRSADLITLERGTLVVNDWKGLTRAAGFDPAYLHLDRLEAA